MTFYFLDNLLNKVAFSLFIMTHKQILLKVTDCFQLYIYIILKSIGDHMMMYRYDQAATNKYRITNCIL